MLQTDERHTSALRVGARFQHLETGNIYILAGAVKMKDPHTRKWKDAVLYMEWPKIKPGADIYVREEQDFRERFKEIRTPV